jgi:hypothetical protein
MKHDPTLDRACRLMIAARVPPSNSERAEIFEKLSLFFIWNTGSDDSDEPWMNVTHFGKTIVVQGIDTNQTLILHADGTWTLDQ